MTAPDGRVRASRVQHVLLTRFNLPSPGAESAVRRRPGWLEDRVRLFDTYCVPSVRHQTDRRSRWLVYVDPASPRWLLDHLAPHVDDGTLRLVAREHVPTADLLADIRAVCDGATGPLLTTNLDNDDGLATDFVERVTAAAEADTRRRAIYVVPGLVREADRLYLRADRQNAFCSVLDPAAEPDTAWLDWHNRLHLHMPTQELQGRPGWLQVVHGSNVSNRARGRRVAARPYRAAFGQLLDGVADPGGGALLRDSLLGRPVRALRDGGRAAARDVALAALGKEGFDRAKSALRGVRS